MKPIATMVLILAAVGAGYYWWSQRLPSTAYEEVTQELPGMGVVGNAEGNTDTFDVTITYTDEGYEPRDITIKKGTRVRFLNQSKSETWPASGVHPTHSLYPEKQSTDCLGSSFDSCDVLSPGEFYDYTFNYTGEWPYHDHEHAYHSGFITVTE